MFDWCSDLLRFWGRVGGMSSNPPLTGSQNIFKSSHVLMFRDVAWSSVEQGKSEGSRHRRTHANLAWWKEFVCYHCQGPRWKDEALNKEHWNKQKDEIVQYAISAINSMMEPT